MSSSPENQKLFQLAAEWCEFTVAPGVDPSLPGIYVWTIGGKDIYVGRYTDVSRPRDAYRRNVERLLNKKAYRPSNPDGFRKIHRDLAEAVRQQKPICVTIIANASREQLNEREAGVIAALKRDGAVVKRLALDDQQTTPEKAASKMWSGRFREPLNKDFERWQRSFPFDWRLLPQEVAASKAHAKTIAAAGILTEAELQSITMGLDALADAYANDALALASDTPEDIHHFVELELKERIGTVALKLHTGRSRNEQIATDLRLYVRDAIDHAMNSLAAWAASLLDVAQSAGDHAMPSYTHLQRAEPVLVAHWLLAYFEMAMRDITRLQDARARINFCPLGSGPIAGATLKLDRTIAANDLGFTAPTYNSMDATSDRDFALEFAQVASTIGLHLSRFAEEITLHATAEFGFIDLPEAFSTGSSAMPQKKNPDFTELVRGKSGRLLGAATTFATILKGLPLAYNKDMQETQEATFEVAETINGMLPLLAPFTAALQFRFDRMQQAAQTGYLNAMAAAQYLVYKGVPFRTAHEKIGSAVRFGLDSGRELNELSLAELKQFGEEFGDDFHDAITLRATLDCHDVIGGTASHRVKQALTEARGRIGALAPVKNEEAEHALV